MLPIKDGIPHGDRVGLRLDAHALLHVGVYMVALQQPFSALVKYQATLEIGMEMVANNAGRCIEHDANATHPVAFDVIALNQSIGSVEDKEAHVRVSANGIVL